MPIYTQCFASLWLDYEDAEIVSCRVLIEDLFQKRFTAHNRDEAIEIFKSGKWREA